MTRRLTEELRAAPATVPALATLALLVAWAADQGGYPVTHWAPGALLVLALLALTATSVPLRIAAIPWTVRVAVLCLAGYTALSFLSILWAGVPGDAWEGANRTLLYLLVFVLFAGWRQRGATAALLLCAWTLALVALAAFTVLHIGGANLARTMPDGRLAYPTGYPNANAAQWLIAFWPALLLARGDSRVLHWALRGLLAGGAVLLAAVALLSQSRGSLYATPVMLALVFALLPGRVRTFATLVPVAAAIAAVAPAVLRVGERLEHGGDAQSALHSAKLAIFAAALAVGALVAVAGALEGRRALSTQAARRVHRGLAALALATLLAVLAGGLALAGDPVARVRHGWDTFKSGSGYAADSRSGSRLTSGLGSNRYDFYRVALDELAAHPLLGIGADNYAQQYLRHGRSSETPHYPHSVELRTLTETGIVGALLALAGLAAALTAAARALRSGADPRARAVAAAALAGFAYWLVHGSIDWFWEFAGLGACAFALLGIACALAPARGEALEHGDALTAGRGEVARGGAEEAEADGGKAKVSRPRLPRLAAICAAGLLALAAAASLAAPWLSRREVQSAARIWPAAPAKAAARLRDAARLNPLSDEALVVAGSIALRFGDLPGAQQEFSRALARVPGDAYATLELGAIASSRGEQRRAVQLLERAVYLDPRNGLAEAALRLARRGRRVDVAALNRTILINAQQIE